MLPNLPNSSQLSPLIHRIDTDDMYNASLLDLNYAVVDLETTGTRPITNQIIEIGIVRIEKGQIVETYETFLNPGVEIPPFITAMTGIRDSDVADAPLLPDITPKILELLENSIFVAHNAPFDYTFLQKNLRACGIELNKPKICTVQLSRKLLPQLAHHKLDDLAKFFHIEIPRRHRALDDAMATGKSLLGMIEMLTQAGKNAFGALTDLSQPSETKKYKILKPTIDALPLSPGVYTMRDKEGRIIYIGKSKCLQKRVRSYFYSSDKKTRKLDKLVETVESIEHEITGSELSALLLESKKIKEHLPHFNTMIRNYKAYPFLKLSNEAFPRLYVTREIKPDGAHYYGPFKSSSLLQHTIEQIQKAFKLRPCKHKINPKKPESLKTCLYYELGDCPGVCGGKMSQEEYLQSVEKAKAFLSGNEQVIVSKLQKQIDDLSEAMDYEKAAEVRDQLLSLERVLEKQQKVARSVKDNNVVIVQDGINRNTKEIFCIKNGIVHSRLTAQASYEPNPANIFDNDSTNWTDESTLDFGEYKLYQSKKNSEQRQIWIDTLSSIYNQPTEAKITKENIDDLMIISTWLMQHGETKNIHYIKHDPKTVANTLAEKYQLR